MRKCKTDLALDALNVARGLAYPEKGYSYFAEIRGDGVKRPRSIWEIINGGGGVGRSPLNGRSPRETLGNIRHAITEESDHAG